MKRNLSLLILFLLLYEPGNAQVFRYRISANSGMFLGELFKKEIEPSGKIPHPENENFSPVFKPGAELEIIAPFSHVFEMGLQFGYDKFYGVTPTPPFYNFFLSRYNPLPNSHKYPDEALYFDSQVLRILITGRWYFLPYTKEINFFLKYFGGVGFTGTDFTFEDPYYRLHYDVGVLFARGTKNSEFPKVSGLTGGAGLGATYRLSDKLDIYFDATTSLINSDIVNGVPNYSAVVEEGRTRMERTNAISAVVQASLGIVYSAIPDRRISKNNITRSTNLNRSKFIKKKSKRTFNKPRRR